MQPSYRTLKTRKGPESHLIPSAEAPWVHHLEEIKCPKSLQDSRSVHPSSDTTSWVHPRKGPEIGTFFSEPTTVTLE